MNTRRVAEIHAQIAHLYTELAAELAANDTTDAAPIAKVKRTRVHPQPLNPPNDIDVARARKILRRRGIHT